MGNNEMGGLPDADRLECLPAPVCHDEDEDGDFYTYPTHRLHYIWPGRIPKIAQPPLRFMNTTSLSASWSDT